MTKREYADYLRSSHWQSVKARYRKEKEWKCLCGETRSLQLHHRTYKRLGRERLTDLQPLCRVCHEKEHGIERIGKLVRLPDDVRLSIQAGRQRVFGPGRHSRRKKKKRGFGTSRRTFNKKVHENNEALHQRQAENRKKREARKAS